MTASHREATRPAAPVRNLGRQPASPPADRHRAARWRDPRLWLGVALVLVAMVAGARILSPPDHSATVWRVSHDIPAGVLVSRADLEPTKVDFGDPAAAAQYVSVAPGAAGGYATRDLTAGEMLTRSALTSRPGAAVRQLPLDVSSAGQPLGLGVGDRVDVWAVPGADGTGSVDPGAADGAPRLVLHDVAILSIGAAESGLDSSRQVLVGLPGSVHVGTVLSRLDGAHVVLVRRGG